MRSIIMEHLSTSDARRAERINAECCGECIVVVVFVGCHDVDASRKATVGTGVEDEEGRRTKEVVFSEGTGC